MKFYTSKYMQIAKGYIKVFLMLTAILTFEIAKAQEQLQPREIVNRLYNAFQYERAAEMLQNIQKKSPAKFTPADKFLLAKCYRNINKYAEAEKVYREIYTDPSLDKSVIIDFANLLKVREDFQSAKRVYEFYIEKGGERNEVDNFIKGCDSAVKWMENPKFANLFNEAAVNTERNDFAATRINKTTMFFTAEPARAPGVLIDGRTEKPFLRGFRAKTDNTKHLTAPSDYNVFYRTFKYHFGLIDVNADSTKIFVTKTYPDKKGREKARAGERMYLTSNLEISEYRLINGKFEEFPFPYNDVSSFSVGHTAYLEKENTLYFVSDMPGGFGGTDIWYSTQNADGTWTKPINAGDKINTSGNEMFPTVDEKGTLYISSNGHIGMGGLDVFKVLGTTGNWSGVENMGYPINSGADDFYYKIYEDDDSHFGYVSSDRDGGKGGDDIYSFGTPKLKNKMFVVGHAYNKKTNELLAGVNIHISNNNSLINKNITSSNGKFLFTVDRSKTYDIKGTLAHYKDDAKSISTQVKNDTIFVKLYLEPSLKVGQTIALENILYDFDKDNVRPDASVILDRLVKILKDNPTMEIELASHTDARGTFTYNDDLSQRRASSAVKYLTTRGINANRMVAKGYGERKLKNDCADGVPCGVEEHQENRRTEFTILKM